MGGATLLIELGFRVFEVLVRELDCHAAFADGGADALDLAEADVAAADNALADAIRARLRNVLVVQTRVELVPWGSLRRSEYKSKLVER